MAAKNISTLNSRVSDNGGEKYLSNEFPGDNGGEKYLNIEFQGKCHSYLSTRKPTIYVSQQVRHKPALTVTDAG